MLRSTQPTSRGAFAGFAPDGPEALDGYREQGPGAREAVNRLAVKPFPDVTESDLHETFAAFGEVQSAAIIKDKSSGESRGFGFVEMPNKDEAEKAIATLNGKDLKGRTATVNEARPRTDKPRTGFGGGRGGGRGGFGGGKRF